MPRARISSAPRESRRGSRRREGLRRRRGGKPDRAVRTALTEARSGAIYSAAAATRRDGYRFLGLLRVGLTVGLQPMEGKLRLALWGLAANGIICVAPR